MVIVIYVKKVKRGRESDDCKKNDDSSTSKKAMLCDDDYIVCMYGVAQIIDIAGINFEIGKRMEI